MTSIAVSCVVMMASDQSQTGTPPSGVHCDHFSKTGDTACYSRADGRQIGTSTGYSGQPLYRNNPSTAAVPNAGTIPSGTYNITGSSQFLNGRPHNNVISLEPQSGTEIYGRSSFKMHSDYANPSRVGTASHGCVIDSPSQRQGIVNNGATGTVTVQPKYPQSYNYGGTVTMPRQTYVPPARPSQSYNHSNSWSH